MKVIKSLFVGLVVCTISTSAYSKPTTFDMATDQVNLYDNKPNTKQSVNGDNFKSKRKLYTVTNHSAVGPRPYAWCGWWMRTVYGGGPEYNLARNWANRGSNAGGPKVGAVVVWHHHVGVITGKTPKGQWVVKSGNDGGAVRERARSVAGAIAFRTL